MGIHPTAIVDKGAEIDPTAEVGAYAIVEKNVHMGPDVTLHPHAYISEGTTLGPRCQVHPFAVIGHPPQDLKYTGEPTFVEVGEDCVIREHATIHRGTAPGTTTVVGKRCFMMATAHIGHNCVVGDDVILVNGSLLAGHVTVGNRAFISGTAAAHQFTRIGELVMLGGQTVAIQDIPPFMLVGRPTHVGGTNVVGLRRAGYDSAERHELRKCFRFIYRSGLLLRDAIDRIEELVVTDPGKRLLAWLREDTKRGILTTGPLKRGNRREAEE